MPDISIYFSNVENKENESRTYKKITFKNSHNSVANIPNIDSLANQLIRDT